MSNINTLPIWEKMRDEYSQMPSQKKLRQLWDAVQKRYEKEHLEKPSGPIQLYRNRYITMVLSGPNPHPTDPIIEKVGRKILCDCGAWTWMELFKMYGLELNQS